MWFLLSGVYLGWSLGANDAANVFGTGVTSGLISYRLAVTLTAIFVILGALMEGTKPMGTVGYFTSLTLFTALLATLSAAATVSLMTYLKLPVSTSQAVVGAVAAIGLAKGIRTVNKKMLFFILLGWISTPLLAASLSFLMLLPFSRII